jgi:ribosomal protein S18 acetylase RimI-like enzyme
VQRQLTNTVTITLVAEVGEELVGTVTLAGTHSDPELADRVERAYISDLAVSPRWQRKGVGARLLAAAESEARRQGFRIVTLTVDERNLPARRLYERSGYQWLKLVNFPWGPAWALYKRLYPANE